MADHQNVERDMAQFFDFTDAEMPDVSQAIADITSAPSPQVVAATCPLHLDQGCFCSPELDDVEPTFGFDLLPDVTDATDPTIRIPKFSRPPAACEYCRTKRLDCFFSYEAQKACTSCTALFRPCSFVSEMTTGAMATLHPVSEDQPAEQGSQTGLKILKSWDYVAGVGDENRLPGRKTGIRFSRDNIKILKAWMNEHRDHPYPTEEEKEQLCQRTGLKAIQISNWLANTRRRSKQAMRPTSPSLANWPDPTEPIEIRPNKQGYTHKSKEWETLTPMDRWKISPPENEPANVEDIAQAVATSSLAPQEVRHDGSRRRAVDSSANSDSNSLWKARSTASLDTGFSAVSSSFSNQSLGSGLSHGSSRNSFSSFGSKVSKDRRRRRRTAANPSKRVNADDRRIFECTFCTDTFKSKYDWSRHEKSLHLSLEKWICSPIGEVLTDPATGTKKCAFCNEINPTPTHLEQHNYRACEEKGLQARTFYRKDHLRQHLRLMHNCKMTPAMEAWKSEASFIKCRCGFCGAEFNRWNDRVDHIAKHFRSGASMKEWKGCRGFEPQVAAQVTNAMPPYLIANESKSPFPFSATNDSSMRQILTVSAGQDLEAVLPNISLETYNMVEAMEGAAQSGSRQSSLPSLTMSSAISHSLTTPPSVSLAEPQYPFGRTAGGSTTCWEILTVRLGRFVAEHMAKTPQIPMTDEMLQHEARMILYDDDDTWNQTAADNPEWLALFKQAHGLTGKAPSAAVFNADFAEDLGIGELTFDHFFEGDNDAALAGLTLGENMQIPATSAAMLEATAGFGWPALTSHAPGVGDMTATTLGMDLSEMEKAVRTSPEIQMMKAVNGQADCMYADCRSAYPFTSASGI